MKNDPDWLSPADYVRGLLGPRRIAEVCGVFWSVPYKWRGTIPSAHHQALLLYAHRLDAPLTPGNLIYGGVLPEKSYVIRRPRGRGTQRGLVSQQVAS